MQEMAPQEETEEQEVKDTKKTKKEPETTGWSRGAENMFCLLPLWDTCGLLKARGSQDRKGVVWRSGAERSAAEGVDRKTVCGSLHAYYYQNRDVGVVGACVVLEVVTQDLVRGQLV